MGQARQAGRIGPGPQVVEKDHPGDGGPSKYIQAQEAVMANRVHVLVTIKIMARLLFYRTPG
jgi:hypothetical protein